MWSFTGVVIVLCSSMQAYFVELFLVYRAIIKLYYCCKPSMLYEFQLIFTLATGGCQVSRLNI